MNVGRYLRGEDRHVGTARTTQPQPPQRTWVGLTDEEIDYFIVHRLTIATKNNLAALIRICEAKLKEKNGV